MVLVALAAAMTPVLATRADAQKQKAMPMNPPPGGGYASPIVSPHSASVTVAPGANSYVFTVTNTGTAAGLVYNSVSCSGTGISGCTISPSSFTLSFNGSRTVTATYTAASSGTGRLQLNVRDTSYNHQDYGWVDVTVTPPPPTYSVSVTPDAGSSAMEPGSTTYNFTVQNTGNSTANYTLTPSCSGVATGCSAPGTVSVGAGQSVAVGVSGLGPRI